MEATLEGVLVESDAIAAPESLGLLDGLKHLLWFHVLLDAIQGRHEHSIVTVQPLLQDIHGVQISLILSEVKGCGG